MEMSKMKLEKGFSSKLLGVPPSMRVKMRYVDHTTHTHTSGAIRTWLLRGNSVFDPDYTYTGHQPSGFDEFAAFFQYYRVVASKIEVISSALTELIPMVTVVRPVREIEAQSQYNAPVESTRAVYGFMPDTKVPNLILHNSATTSALYSGQSSTDQDFGSLVTTNPAKVWYWEVLTQSANQASTASLAITVVVEYEVIFSQKEILATS
jgi:hypothetical protein